jgi:hypothetical protein
MIDAMPSHPGTTTATTTSLSLARIVRIRGREVLRPARDTRATRCIGVS